MKMNFMFPDEFLGEAVIFLDSLERNPSSRQIIPLQGRLSESDNIKGSLTVEVRIEYCPQGALSGWVIYNWGPIYRAA